MHQSGTQTVFGEGPTPAVVMMIGEQPGDAEDKSGRPFVGPAGRLLDEALERMGLSHDQIYLTNAVKHFKWEPRGTRRIHSKPNMREVMACKPWLSAELQVVAPKMVVCLGATAAQDLLGKDFRITRDRGRVFTDTSYAPWLMATLHPSALLRIPDPQQKARAYDQFLADLAAVKQRFDVEVGRH